MSSSARMRGAGSSARPGAYGLARSAMWTELIVGRDLFAAAAAKNPISRRFGRGLTHGLANRGARNACRRAGRGRRRRLSLGRRSRRSGALLGGGGALKPSRKLFERLLELGRRSRPVFGFMG